MKTVFLITLFIPFLLFSSQKRVCSYTDKISGHVVDSVTLDSIPWVFVKLLKNDILSGISLSDFDGKFTIINMQSPIDNDDNLVLQFFYINNVFKEVHINNNSLTNLKISLKINGKNKASEIIKWREDFIQQNQLNGWFDCE